MSSEYRKPVLPIVLGQGGRKDDDIPLEVAAAEPRYLAPTLSGEDAQLHDGAERISEGNGSPARGRKLPVGEDTAAGRTLDGLESLAGRAVDVVAAGGPPEEDFDRGDGVVLLRDRLLQPVDAVVDILRSDFRELSCSEGKVALEDALVVADGAGPVLLLTDGEEELHGVIPCDALRPVLPQCAHRQESLGFLPRVSEGDEGIAADRDELSVCPQLHDEALRAAL